MKSLEELKQIRDRVKDQVDIREGSAGKIRVVVGMATCGIASGAKPVLSALADEVQRRHLKNVIVTQTGCIGLCQYEPIVEVYEPGRGKTTYIKMNAEKAKKVADKHLEHGLVVNKYTLASEGL